MNSTVRRNQDVHIRRRCVLRIKSKPSTFITEAVSTACYIRNRLHSTATADFGKTPYEVLLNKKPDLSHVRMFGSKGFVHTPKVKRKGKLERRAKIVYLV